MSGNAKRVSHTHVLGDVVAALVYYLESPHVLEAFGPPY